MLERIDLPVLQARLREMGIDGWLLYHFRGNNPVAGRILGGSGMATRRLFVLLPAEGAPVAIGHRIELQGLQTFPGEVRVYAAWQSLHEELGRLVSGRTVAMEVSADDAVPYLDRIPWGVVGLIERLGGTIVPSDDLVSAFAAGLTDREIAGHLEIAEIVADVARATVRDTVHQAGEVREWEVQQRVLAALDRAQLEVSHPPIVAFGANAANPHYEPRKGADAVLEPDQVVLLDLWGFRTGRAAHADQTWMGFSGGTPPEEVVRVWETVRDARIAVVDRLTDAWERGETLTGAALDDCARGVIRNAGYGDAFVHRTGHSIDVDLHGSGPHLDNFESHDTRPLIPGVAFSVEPGIYLEGRFGVRSEINVVMRQDGPIPTPRSPQAELFLPS